MAPLVQAAGVLAGGYLAKAMGADKGKVAPPGGGIHGLTTSIGTGKLKNQGTAVQVDPDQVMAYYTNAQKTFETGYNEGLSYYGPALKEASKQIQIGYQNANLTLTPLSYSSGQALNQQMRMLGMDPLPATAGFGDGLRGAQSLVADDMPWIIKDTNDIAAEMDRMGGLKNTDERIKAKEDFNTFIADKISNMDTTTQKKLADLNAGYLGPTSANFLNGVMMAKNGHIGASNASQNGHQAHTPGVTLGFELPASYVELIDEWTPELLEKASATTRAFGTTEWWNAAKRVQKPDNPHENGSEGEWQNLNAPSYMLKSVYNKLKANNWTWTDESGQFGPKSKPILSPNSSKMANSEVWGGFGGQPGFSESTIPGKALYDQQKAKYDSDKEVLDRATQLMEEVKSSKLNATDFLNNYADEYDNGYTGEEIEAQVASLPGYAFQLGEGTKAIERQGAAQGMLGSANTEIGLQKFGQGLGMTYYNQYMGYLGGLVAQGSPATAQISSNQSALGTALGTLAQNLGMAQMDTARQIASYQANSMQHAGDMWAQLGMFNAKEQNDMKKAGMQQDTSNTQAALAAAPGIMAQSNAMQQLGMQNAGMVAGFGGGNSMTPSYGQGPNGSTQTSQGGISWLSGGFS